jgi:preprotein translocase SecE subunit
MENQFQKWVSLSYLVAAFIVAYLCFSLSLNLSSTFELETKYRHIDLAVRGVSLVAGLITFLILYFNRSSNQFMNEVMLEVSRVTWPTQSDTTKATFVVVIMVIITGMILGALDQVWTKLIQWAL